MILKLPLSFHTENEKPAKILKIVKGTYDKKIRKISYLEYILQQEKILESARGRKNFKGSGNYKNIRPYFRSFFNENNWFCHVQRMILDAQYMHIFICNGIFYEKRLEVISYFGRRTLLSPVSKDRNEMLKFCDAIMEEIESLPNLRCKYVAKRDKANSVFYSGRNEELFEISIEEEKGKKALLIQKVKRVTIKRNFGLVHNNSAFNSFFEEVKKFYKAFRENFV